MFTASLCQEHHAQQQESDRRRERALAVLHYRVSDTAARKSDAFADDWRALRDRWRIVCDVMTSQRGRRNLSLEEAEYAMIRCTSLALELLDAEDAAAQGRSPASSPQDTRRWVLERLRSLDAGLIKLWKYRGNAARISRR